MVDAFRTRASLKINAFAGSGKTSTLQLLGSAAEQGGLYLAFNRALADEARTKFPQTIQCKTTHGLAFRQIKHLYAGNASKLTDSLNANRIVEVLGLDDLVIDGHVKLPARSLGALTLECTRQFQRSAAERIEPGHLPKWGILGQLTPPARNELEAHVVKLADSLWDRMKDPRDPVPLGHDGYLKLWALTHPTIGVDCILLDEAQDTNAVVLDLLARQPAQMVYVGDRYQQIYEWRGAVNAMDAVRVEQELYLTMSFRFGPSIARAASVLIGALGETRSIQGNPKISSSLGCSTPETVLCRTNSTVLQLAVAEASRDTSIHIIGGGDELRRLVEGVSDLQQNGPSSVPELFGFASWEDVVAFSESEEGHSLRTLVGLVDRHGVKQLRWALSQSTAREEDAKLVLSTAHKSKGRQWERVAVSSDFSAISTDELGRVQIDPAELRLLYVAMTRARYEVELPPDVVEHFKLPHPRRAPAASTPPNGGTAPRFALAQESDNSDPIVADRVAEPPPRDGIAQAIKRLFGL